MSKLNSNVVKELRRKKGVIQADVAKAIGIGRTGYVRIENGERDADTNTLLKLADYFSVSVDFLLGRIEAPAYKEIQYDDKEIKELAELFGKLSKEDQEAILRITKGMANKQ